MRRFFAAVLMAVIAAPTAAQTSSAQPVVLPNETILRVEGEGKVAYRPELLVVSIGVATTADSAEQALAENAVKSASLTEAIRAAGIPPKDIRTSSLDIRPVYSENEDEDIDQIIGWRANNTFSVRTSRIVEAGQMIAELFAAGGNTLRGPTFELTAETMREAQRASEVEALTNAREKAEATAAALGMRISRVLLVSDGRQQVGYIDQRNFISVADALNDLPLLRSLAIEPGEIEVTASYNIEFALVPLD